MARLCLAALKALSQFAALRSERVLLGLQPRHLGLKGGADGALLGQTRVCAFQCDERGAKALKLALHRRAAATGLKAAPDLVADQLPQFRVGWLRG